MLHQKNVMQRRNDRKSESRAQECGARNPHPAHGPNLKQKNEEDRADLGKSIGLAENAGTEIAQPGYGKQHGAGGENGNIAAENQHRELPLNLVQNGEHQEHGAQQELVGNGIEILAQQSLLVKRSGQQSIQTVAEAGDDENNQRPQISALDQMDHDEGNENHAQQRELVWRREDLGILHGVCPIARKRIPRTFLIGGASITVDGKNHIEARRPVVANRRSASDGTRPQRKSSSMRSTRCMGKKTIAGVQGSPSFTMAARSSKDARSTPHKLKPVGAEARTIPRNFAFGLPRLTTASVPGVK